MGDYGITLDKAILLSCLLGALLYGFSLLMFGGTIAVLHAQRLSGPINRRMVAVACLLLLFSTAHFVIDTIRVMQGLILFRNTYPGGPLAFFGDVSQWTFIAKNSVYTAQTLIGDGVVIYRCYVVWQSKLVLIILALLWCSVVVTGVASPYIASRSGHTGVFSASTLDRWVTYYYASTLVTNLLATTLLAYRIWSVDRATARLVNRRKSRLRHLLHVIIDAGVIYSVSLLAALLCFVCKSHGQDVLIDMIPPIIAITFYMVIIRVGLASLDTNAITTFSLSLKWASANDNAGHNANGDLQVCVATSTKRKTENCSPSLVVLKDPLPLDSDSRYLDETKPDTAGGTV